LSSGAFTSFYIIIIIIIIIITIRFVDGLFVNINIIKKLAGAFGLSLCLLGGT
jgi:hypothetical protein